MTDIIRGPQLPAYETDTLGWLRAVLNGERLVPYGVSAEVLIGESAILLRFPSGGERVLYLDEQPRAGSERVSLAEARLLSGDLDEARAERDEATRLEAGCADDLQAALTVVENARVLLERIAAGDQAEPAPAWLRGEAYTFLRTQPDP